MEKEYTIQDAAKDAIAVQDACNICGVAQAFARAMKVVNKECHNTDEVTNHPVTVLFVDKMRSMQNEIDFNRYKNAMEAVEKMAANSVSV